MTLLKQVCVQLPTYADNLALPAFARRPPLLQQTCSSGFAAVQGPCWDGQRDGRTPRRLIDLTPQFCFYSRCEIMDVTRRLGRFLQRGFTESLRIAAQPLTERQIFIIISAGADKPFHRSYRSN